MLFHVFPFNILLFVNVKELQSFNGNINGVKKRFSTLTGELDHLTNRSRVGSQKCGVYKPFHSL